MAAEQPTTTVVGVVQQIRTKDGRRTGYKVNDSWFNISLYPKGPIADAEVGDTIRAVCTLYGRDDALMAGELVVTAYSGHAAAPRLPTPNGAHAAPPPPSVLTPTFGPSAEGVRIQARCRAIAAASSFLALKPDVLTVAQLLSAAEEIEAWILDPEPHTMPFEAEFEPIPELPD